MLYINVLQKVWGCEKHWNQSTSINTKNKCFNPI